MKKQFKKGLIASLLLALMVALPVSAASSLWEYYNGSMPSLSKRAYMAATAGIVTHESLYAGTYDQNVALLEYLQSGDSMYLTPIFRTPTEAIFGITIPTIVALFEDNLQNKISSTATTMTLVSGTDKEGNSLSGTYGFIIDEGSSNEEFVIATCAATACSSMLRGISVVDGETEVTALKQEHRRGASVKATNFPQLAILSRVLNGQESLPTSIYYDTGVGQSPIASSSSIMSKTYIDNLVNQGAATSTESTGGIVELSTAAEQAASTYYSADQPLCLQAQYASSTPSAQTPNNYVVVAETDGKLNQSWFDLTEATTYSGYLGASSTSEFASSTITNANLTRSTTTERMTIDTGGSLCFGYTCTSSLPSLTTATTSATYYVDTSYDFVGGLSYTITPTTTISGGSLGANGMMRVTFGGQFNGSSNGAITQLDIIVKMNSTDVCKWTITDNVSSGYAECLIGNSNNTASQRFNGTLNSAGVIKSYVIKGTSSINTASDIELNIVCERMDHSLDICAVDTLLVEIIK